ncbi:MAG: ATP-binding cassette domain-containing protein [Spirochaetota bacterium]
MRTDPLFTISGLRFEYTGKPVLSIDELALPEQEVSVIAGGNGSGKTTLLKLLNGLLNPVSGEILFRGKPLTEGINILRKESVLVHQNPYLFSGTVYQNVSYGLKIRNTKKSGIPGKVEEALKRVGLSDFEKRKTHELSGGEKQRVAIARALVIDPLVLLLDEPTANVDAESIRLIESLIRSLPLSGTSVVLSSHNPGFAFRVSTGIITLEEGRVVPNHLNIYKGAIVKKDDHFSYFKTGNTLLRCPTQDGDFTAAVISAADIILSEKAIYSSAQNQFPGRVESIAPGNGTDYITLDCGFSIKSKITRYSLEKMGIEIGKQYYVSFKASSIKLF